MRFNNTAGTNRGRLLCSGLGNFSDTTTIATFNPTSGTPGPSNFPYAVDQWYDVSISIDPSDVGGALTDTAQLRFAQDTGGAQSARVYFDNIGVTGVCDPGADGLRRPRSCGHWRTTSQVTLPPGGGSLVARARPASPLEWGTRTSEVNDYCYSVWPGRFRRRCRPAAQRRRGRFPWFRQHGYLGTAGADWARP